MKVVYLHASKFGNGARVAAEFEKQMSPLGAAVETHHIDRVRSTALPPADLYVFSAPGRMGKPIRRMRRFLGETTLPAGTRYALLTTEAAPQPDKRTGVPPSEAELAKTQRVRPVMTEILQAKGLVKVAEERVLVTGIKGPLEVGWEEKVAAFARRLPAG